VSRYFVAAAVLQIKNFGLSISTSTPFF